MCLHLAVSRFQKSTQTSAVATGQTRELLYRDTRRRSGGCGGQTRLRHLRYNPRVACRYIVPPRKRSIRWDAVPVYHFSESVAL